MRQTSVKAEVGINHRVPSGVLWCMNIAAVRGNDPTGHDRPGLGDVDNFPSLRDVSERSPEVDVAVLQTYLSALRRVYPCDGDSEASACLGEELDVGTLRRAVGCDGVVRRRINIADAKRLCRACRVPEPVGDEPPSSAP